MAAGVYTTTIKRKGHAAVLMRSATMTESHAELLAQINEALISAIPHAHDAAVIRGGPIMGAMHNAVLIQALLHQLFVKFAPRVTALLDTAETEAPFIERIRASEEARQRAS